MKRTVIRLLLLSVAVGCSVVTAASCGDPLSSSAADGGSGDAAADIVPPPPLADAAGDSDARACRPGIPEPRPRWVPSRPFHEPACSATEVDAFFASCAGADDAACAKFVADNPRCAECAYSEDSDPSYGPIIGHRTENYRYLNFGGCIGNRLGETEGGCGEAASLFDQCRYRSCHGCYAVTLEEQKAFLACLTAAEGSTYCSVEATRYLTRCNGEFADENPDGAIAFCERMPTEQAYVRLFCTADPSADGGADSGDGG